VRQDWARVLTYVLFVAGVLLPVEAVALLELSGASNLSGRAALGQGLGLAVTGLLAGAAMVPPVLSRLARLLPVQPDNPVHQVAAAISVLVVGYELSTQLTTDIVALAAVLTPLQPIDLVLQDLPFLLAALAGVGLLVRRGGRESMQRLGLVVPGWWQIGLGVVAAGVIFALGTGMGALGQAVTPHQAHRVEEATKHLFGQLRGPLGLFAIALVPGVCEEALFRGALQPRFGIVWTAVVFAAVHSQYGLSFDLLAVLVLAMVLGVVRRLANTTTAVLAHVGYNAVVGVDLNSAMIAVGVASEVVLLAVLAWVGGRRLMAARAGRSRSS
jgi:membrane protease YdiL (CAAX protease family)